MKFFMLCPPVCLTLTSYTMSESKDTKATSLPGILPASHWKSLWKAHAQEPVTHRPKDKRDKLGFLYVPTDVVFLLASPGRTT